MTSSRRRPGRPVRSVELRVSIEAGRAEARRLRLAFPESETKGKAVEFTIRGTDPKEVEARGREAMEKMRDVLKGRRDPKRL